MIKSIDEFPDPYQRELARQFQGLGLSEAAAIAAALGRDRVVERPLLPEGAERTVARIERLKKAGLTESKARRLMLVEAYIDQGDSEEVATVRADELMKRLG